MSKKIFDAYSIGPVMASVCSNLSTEELLAEMNNQHPTGISNDWMFSEDTHFLQGQPNPCQCEDNQDCKHYLLNC